MSDDTTPIGRKDERGAALVLALFMVVILTVLGLGLVLRSKTSMAVAGAERPVTKNFYAAEAGVQAAFSRLQVENPCPFEFNRQDSRTAGGGFPIAVNVATSVRISDPHSIQGSEVGGGMGGTSTRLVRDVWRLGASTLEVQTQTRRAVEAEISIGPKTVTISPPCNTTGSSVLPTPGP